jgi:cytochrome c oxidase cbb3-type subunit III
VSKTPVKKTPQDPETTGHSWDGIEEFNNPLPRWWLWTFYATIIWGIGYTIAYPAWPLVTQATPGLLGFSTRANVQADIDRVIAQNAALTDRLEGVELASISDDPELAGFAVNKGAAIFRSHCSQCHGSGAAGAVGYPNLLDDDWLWGGTLDEIAYTITHGIRNEQSPDTLWSQMPAFGEILESITSLPCPTRSTRPPLRQRERRSTSTSARPATWTTAVETRSRARRTSPIRSGSTAATSTR